LFTCSPPVFSSFLPPRDEQFGNEGGAEHWGRCLNWRSVVPLTAPLVVTFHPFPPPSLCCRSPQKPKDRGPARLVPFPRYPFFCRICKIGFSFGPAPFPPLSTLYLFAVRPGCSQSASRGNPRCIFFHCRPPCSVSDFLYDSPPHGLRYRFLILSPPSPSFTLPDSISTPTEEPCRFLLEPWSTPQTRKFPKMFFFFLFLF